MIPNYIHKKSRLSVNIQTNTEIIVSEFLSSLHYRLTFTHIVYIGYD